MSSYQNVFQRKEVKYLLTKEQKETLLPVLYEHMRPDDFPHSSISNLYYDTPDYYLIRHSLEKPKYKEKLRLRCYGVPDAQTQAFLEIKKKAKGIVYKRRESLPYDQALSYLNGEGGGGDSQIFHELDWMLHYYKELKPRVFLSYERDSLKGKENPNLRLTLDQDIRWRTKNLDLSLGNEGEELLEKDQTLMEIKIPNALPLWLAEVLSELSIFPVSFSKYGRAYERMCGIHQEELERRVLYLQDIKERYQVESTDMETRERHQAGFRYEGASKEEQVQLRYRESKEKHPTRLRHTENPESYQAQLRHTGTEER